LFRAQTKKSLCRTLFAQGKLVHAREGATGCPMGICSTSDWVKAATQTTKYGLAARKPTNLAYLGISTGKDRLCAKERCSIILTAHQFLESYELVSALRLASLYSSKNVKRSCEKWY